MHLARRESYKRVVSGEGATIEDVSTLPGHIQLIVRSALIIVKQPPVQCTFSTGARVDVGAVSNVILFVRGCFVLVSEKEKDKKRFVVILLGPSRVGGHCVGGMHWPL